VHTAQQPTDHPRGAGRAQGQFEALRRLNTSLSGFAPVNRRAFDDSEAERRAMLKLEQPGLHEAHEQLLRPALQRGGERRVVRVHRREDP
jgi:hypothetical protein